jgi:hypothetical protein
VKSPLARGRPLLPRLAEDIRAGSLSDYALTALLLLESLILFVAGPLAAMDIRVPLVLAILVIVPLILAIVIISSSTGARFLASVAMVLAAGGIAFRIGIPRSSPFGSVTWP